MQLALHIRVIEMNERGKKNPTTYKQQSLFTRQSVSHYKRSLLPPCAAQCLSIPNLTVSRIGQFMHGEHPTVINPHLDTLSSNRSDVFCFKKKKTSAFQLLVCSSYKLCSSGSIRGLSDSVGG